MRTVQLRQPTLDNMIHDTFDPKMTELKLYLLSILGRKYPLHTFFFPLSSIGNDFGVIKMEPKYQMSQVSTIILGLSQSTLIASINYCSVLSFFGCSCLIQYSSQLCRSANL